MRMFRRWYSSISCLPMPSGLPRPGLGAQLCQAALPLLQRLQGLRRGSLCMELRKAALEHVLYLR